jgi:CBS domain-containing protein
LANFLRNANITPVLKKKEHKKQKRGENCSVSLKIRDVMVKNVITVDSDYTVKHVAYIMNRCGIGCVLVLENKNLVGIITERDILRKIVAVARDPEETFVREIMSTPIIVVGPDMVLEKALDLMFEHKIKKLPVMERSSGKQKLLGLVTLTDIARLQPQLIKRLKQLFAEKREVPPKNIDKVMNYYIV